MSLGTEKGLHYGAKLVLATSMRTAKQRPDTACRLSSASSRSGTGGGEISTWRTEWQATSLRHRCKLSKVGTQLDLRRQQALDGEGVKVSAAS